MKDWTERLQRSEIMLKPVIDAINKLIIRELSDMNDRLVDTGDALVSELRRLNDTLERLSNLNQ